MLRQLSLLYDVPFAYFSLDAPPEEPPLKDYRGVPKQRRTKFSPETKLALREFRRLNHVAQTLQEIAGTTIAPRIGVIHPQKPSAAKCLIYCNQFVKKCNVLVDTEQQKTRQAPFETRLGCAS